MCPNATKGTADLSASLMLLTLTPAQPHPVLATLDRASQQHLSHRVPVLLLSLQIAALPSSHHGPRYGSTATKITILELEKDGKDGCVCRGTRRVLVGQGCWLRGRGCQGEACRSERVGRRRKRRGDTPADRQRN